MQYNFYGGIHPSTFKSQIQDRPTKKVYIPKKAVIPLSQHTGSPAECIVNAGDAVKAGQPIGRPAGKISAAIHATISGKITRIAPSPTPTMARSLAVTIESSDSDDQEMKLPHPGRVDEIEAMPVEGLLDIIRDAGIVGLGGAAFPTHVKLSPPKTKPIDTIILNGAECEPYLSCDHRLMLEKTKEILKGLDIIVHITGAKKAYIAIEDNKLSAVYAMEREVRKINESRRPRHIIEGPFHDAIKVASLHTKYPQGAEKQVIKAVLDRAVPAGGLPMDVGCIVQNVGTAFAIYEAVYLGKPLIERSVTVAGDCLKEPVNLCVRVGTLISDLAETLGGFAKEPRKVVVGGPMMGLAQYTMDVPIVKGTSGILFLSKDALDRTEESVCIRCGKCVEICPMGLSPTTLMYRVKRENFADAKDMGIANCYECGACAYACPAKIPLLDYMKFGKAKVITV